CGKGVGHRHLAGLVALETHALQDVLPSEPRWVSFDQLQQLLPFAPPAAASATTAGRLPGLWGFAGFRRFVGVDCSHLVVDCRELLFKLVLLVEDLFAFCVQAFALSRYIILEGFSHRGSSSFDNDPCSRRRRKITAISHQFRKNKCWLAHCEYKR